MNQLEIKRFIDKLIAESETRLDELFARMLKEILTEIEQMYAKYQKKGELSYTDLNKYNRLHSLFERIIENTTEEYRMMIQEITAMRQTVYVENYLRTAYLFEVFSSIAMGFTVPSVKVIEAALTNPIEHLKLNKVLEKHRNVIVEDLQTIITQGLLRGSSYWEMASEIEKKVGFHKNKAIMVARTEAGRAQSIADEQVGEVASKYAKLEKMWASALDFRVRVAHRKLDGQRADEEGYFHYQGLKAYGPHMWHRADMDINCRCVVLRLVNGMLPTVRKGRDYRDQDYQKRFQEAVEQFMEREDLTLIQAINKANKHVLPPNKLFENYISFDEWKEQMTGEDELNGI